ncbi:UNVERIFIED_CONTAM: hypothetical protein Sradi_4936400 [Sesamum radiatum]|uniref:Uncharacterized protein n=1 Tax=Sesamum radiatum TaxID=300843 RepID=A0AAW2MDU2_SESRA
MEALIMVDVAWHVEKISTKFEAYDAKWIWLTELGGGAEDRLCWDFNNKERFMVKSAYRISTNLADPSGASETNSVNN